MSYYTTKDKIFSFLKDGGEMGELIRSKDWCKTSVGNPENWPQSLRLILSIMVNSKFPMFLFWGPELICFYNDAYRPSLGNEGKHPNILGSRGEDCWQEIWKDIKPIIDGVWAGGPSTLYEDMLLPIYRNNKLEDVYWTFCYSAINDESDNIAGIFVTCNETTSKVNALKKLKESEEQFHVLAETLPQFIWETDEKGNSIYTSCRWEEYTGINPRGIEEWKAVVHPDDYENINNAWMYSLMNGTIYIFDVRLRSKNGEYKWFHVEGVPILDFENKITKWVGAFTDVHKIKEEEQRKSDFIKMVSHELITPVTSIKGYVQILLSMVQQEKEKESSRMPLNAPLMRVDRQLLRLTRLITEIFDISRIEEKRLELKKEKFNINDLVTETVEDVLHVNSNYIIDLLHNFIGIVDGDKDRIQQVLINFINNAIKYSSEIKSIEVQINKTSTNQVAISVKDYGIGISKSDQKKIFERFYRVEGKSEKIFPGLGIGLFISNEIIERHHGKILVESELGKGAVFTFLLPLE